MSCNTRVHFSLLILVWSVSAIDFTRQILSRPKQREEPKFASLPFYGLCLQLILFFPRLPQSRKRRAHLR